MSNPWFRMYNEILNDPKVQSLPGDVFKIWVNCMCWANSLGHSDGKIGNVSETAFALRVTEATVSSAFHVLLQSDILITDGETFHIKNWSKRQYKSDNSYERVKRHRQRYKNVTVTPPESDQNRSDQNRSDRLDRTEIVAPRDDDDDDEIFNKILRIGIKLHPQLANRTDTGVIKEWLKQGFRPDSEIIPELQRLEGRDIGSWKYFTDGLHQSRKRKKSTNGHEKPPEKLVELTPEEREKRKDFMKKMGIHT